MKSNLIDKISLLKEGQLVGLALLLSVIVAYFSVGFHHFDEHFQLIEFMNYKLGNTKAADLPWEFHRRMRPWLQPYLYLILDSPLRAIGASPFSRMFFLRLCSGIFSIFSIYYLYRNVLKSWYNNLSDKRTALFVMLFTWFIPYIAVRPSAESLSAGLFFLGVGLCLKEKPKFFTAGILLGFCYLSRYQMALPIAVLWFWGIFSQKWKPKYLALYACGILILIALGIALDSYAYSQFTFALYNYFKANFLDGVLKHMGVSPWYKYLEWSIVKLLPPISLVLTLGVFSFWKNNYRNPKSWMTWITLTFFIFHSYIGHKEYRFIFLCALLAPVMSFSTYGKKIPNFFVILNFIFILTTLKPANKMIPLYKYIYYNNIEHIYFVDETPLTLVGLPLNFYFKRGLRSEALGLSPVEGKYIFTKRFSSTRKFLKKGCEALYINYPHFIFKEYPASIKKYLERQKVMGLFHCEAEHEK